MSSFKWLHFSDLHQGVDIQGWIWPDVSERLYEDLARKHELTGPWHAVFFTGDLTQKAAPDEFQKVTDLLGQLWANFEKLGSHPIFLPVPGNHDLEIPKNPRSAEVKALRLWADDPEVREEFWSNRDSSTRQLIKTVFANYVKWKGQLNFPKPTLTLEGLLPGDFSATLKVDDLKVGVLGLNSAFLQITLDHHYEGKLSLAPGQFHEACGGDGPGWAKDHDICLLLTHHPPRWLEDDAQKTLQGTIARPGRFALHLCGHMHEGFYESRGAGGAQAWHMSQGYSLLGLEKLRDGKTDRRHGYTIGGIDLRPDATTIQLWPRLAHKNQMGVWDIKPDPEFNLNNEKIEIFLPIERSQPGSRTPALSKILAPASPTRTPHDMPERAGSFFEHSDQIRDLEAMLRVGGFVFVYGIFGIGKSCLALELAHRMYAGGTLHGVKWFDANHVKAVQSAGGHEECLREIARVLLGDRREGDIQQLEEELYRFLRDRKCLIVIDNVEHGQIDIRLLEYLKRVPKPSCVMITTQTIPSAAHGWCKSIQLECPSLEEAMRFFLEGFEPGTDMSTLSPRDRGFVDTICNTVSRHPQLIDLLRRESDLALSDVAYKSNSYRGDDAREVWMTSLDRLLGTLDENSKTMLTRLCALGGTMTAELRDAVANVPNPAVCTETLVRTAIWKRIARNRYAINPLVRNWVRRTNDPMSDIERQVAAQTAQTALKIAEFTRPEGPTTSKNPSLGYDQASALDWFEAEWENLKLCSDLAQAQQETETLCILADSILYFMLIRGHLTDCANKFYLRAIDVYEKKKDVFGLARMHNGLGVCRQFQENWDEAEKHLNEAIALFKQLDLPDKDERLAKAYNSLGFVLLQSGQVDKAEVKFMDALDKCRQSARRAPTSNSAADADEVQRCKRLGVEAAQTLSNLGLVRTCRAEQLTKEGHKNEAAMELSKGEEAFERSRKEREKLAPDDPRLGQTHSRRGYLRLLGDKNAWIGAREDFDIAIPILRRANDFRELWLCYRGLGRVRQKFDDNQGAKEAYYMSLSYELGSCAERSEVLNGLADVCDKLGAAKEAEDVRKRAWKLNN